jgi:flagellar basal body rod protein FlgG
MISWYGNLADVTTNNLSNATAIGYNAKIAASNSMVLGATGVNQVKVGIGTTTPSTTLDIAAPFATNPLHITGLPVQARGGRFDIDL